MDACARGIYNGLISAEWRYSEENNAVAVVDLGASK